MFNIIDLFIASTFICLVMALVVWLRVKSNAKPDNQDAEVRDQRTAAFFTRAGIWAISAVNFVIGVLLGVALNGLVQLILTGAWVAVFNTVVLAAVLFFIVSLHDRLGKKLFSSGIRPARKSGRVRETPLLRRLSLPLGLVLGVILAGLGSDDYLLGWFLSVP